MGNLPWLGDGQWTNRSFMAVAALILEVVKSFMNYNLERLLHTKNSLTSYILCLIWPFAKLQKSVLKSCGGMCTHVTIWELVSVLWAVSSRWLGGLQLEPYVALPAFHSCSGELGTDGTQLLVFSEIWSLQPFFWRGWKEFKNWVSLSILWRGIAKIEVPALRTRSATLSHSILTTFLVPCHLQ